ncbi:MAG: methylmalonyl-CoA mutase [Euzebyaceae bacterium]|nr:methylmalonyl-CoA mutase [Euzebyaceae bacterium]
MREWRTRSGLPLPPAFTAADVPAGDVGERIGMPGSPPFVRGITADGYRTEPWIMGQYGGFGTAEETNLRLRELLAAGQTGFSIALDLPTQMGLDSDHPLAAGEVGKVGVSIDSLADMELLLAGVDLTQVRQIRTTANAIGHLWLALVVAACENAGVDPGQIRVLIQNDVLKEYFARGTFIHPPAAGLSIVADVVAYCATQLPAWTPVTLSGYHIREAGADAVQEVAFSIANGIAYCEAVTARGLDVDAFAPSLFTFLSASIDFLEEVAKFRAARLVWSRVMDERFGARDPRSRALRIFAFTAGSLLRAQQPLNNVARVTIEALAAVLGGVQTLHASGYDEALGMPTSAAATLALRTQQILLEETGLRAVADPLGGSWAVEALTDELARRVWAVLDDIEKRGGAIACIESGWFAAELARGAYEQQVAEESGDQRVVGVNCYDDAGTDAEVVPFSPDPAGERRQRDRTARVRRERDPVAVAQALAGVAAAASAGESVVPPTIDAVRAYATVGEVTAALRAVYGSHLAGGA